MNPPPSQRRSGEADGQLGRRRVSARSGATLLELLVAFTLLVSTMTVAVPLVVRHGRLLTTARHYRIAVEEVTNQLERLVALPPEQLPGELKQLTPSEFTAERLQGAKVTGTLEPADLGQRLTIAIVWDEPRRSEAPVQLAAWIIPEPNKSTGGLEGSP